MAALSDAQLSLLGGLGNAWENFDLPGAEVRLLRSFLPAADAEGYFGRLFRHVSWKQDTIRIYGKEHNVPRLHQWYGDSGLVYRWSGITMHPEPWSPLVLQIKERVERCVSARFNTVLLNLYRDGNDGVSWHSDDEPELGPTPIIGSVSLGGERDFMLRRNGAGAGADVKISLPHGSLLTMAGGTQANWQHSIPKRRVMPSPRINLTFRLVNNKGGRA